MHGSKQTLSGSTQLSALCGWAAALEVEAIPRAVLSQAAMILCDDLAAMISARADPVLSKVREQLLRNGGRNEATVFDGGSRRTDRYTAAVANGAAAPWNELDEGSRRVPCHAGIYALPALLADAESEKLTTLQTLRALVIAYEVVTRFALAFPQSELKLHPHAVFSAVGAAAAVAAARQYDRSLFLHTLTLAASFAIPGPFSHAVRGSFARNMWVAQGAWSGLRSADWAACGIDGLDDGPKTILSGVLGLELEPERLSEGLGTDWIILQNFHKLYPCCQYAHSMVDAMAAIQASLPSGFAAEACESIGIEIHDKGLKLDAYEPHTILAARFSVPHIAAVMALRGRIDAVTLSSDSLADARVTALRNRVEMRLYKPELPPPNDRPARVTLKFPDGREFSAECLCASGSPTTPFSADVIRGKIAGICSDAYPAMEEIVAELTELQDGILKTPWSEVVGTVTGRQ